MKDTGGFVSLPSLLRFITGVSTVPPLGLPSKIQISYLNGATALLESHACFCKVSLPITHESKEAFFNAFTKALQLCRDYGLV